MDKVIDLRNKRPDLNPPKEPEFEILKTPDSRIISWSSPAQHRPDIKFLVGTSVLFFVIAALVQIFQKNIITTIFFALLGTVLLLNIKRKPEIGTFEVNPAGVSINGKVFRFGEIKSFWIEYEPDLRIKELSLQLKRWYSQYIKIPLEDKDPLRLRLALLEFLPEVEHKDSIVEILARKLGI